MKTEKIGTLSFVYEGKEYFTEFRITPKTKEYIKKEDISLGVLIPNGWEAYDGGIFHEICDKEGNYDKRFGKEFETIYYGILESRKYTVEDIIEKGSEENIKEFEKKEIIRGERNLSSVKNPKKSFNIKFITIKK